jgi:hypothetical protein
MTIDIPMTYNNIYTSTYIDIRPICIENIITSRDINPINIDSKLIDSKPEDITPMNKNSYVTYKQNDINRSVMTIVCTDRISEHMIVRSNISYNRTLENIFNRIPIIIGSNINRVNTIRTIEGKQVSQKYAISR